jgi:hypothetical protein
MADICHFGLWIVKTKVDVLSVFFDSTLGIAALACISAGQPSVR